MHRIPRRARALAIAVACAALLTTFAGSALATDEPSLGIATTTTTPQTCGPDGCGELGCTVTAAPGPVDASTALVLAKKVKTCITITVAFTQGPVNARRPFVQGFTSAPNNTNLDFVAEFDNQGRPLVAVRFKPGVGVSMADCGAPGAELVDQNARTVNAASPKNLQFYANAGRNETIAFVGNHGYQRFTVSVTCNVPE
jgi:hypothetical protein